jgi:hypothetical protein
MDRGERSSGAESFSLKGEQRLAVEGWQLE